MFVRLVPRVLDGFKVVSSASIATRTDSSPDSGVL